MARRPILIDATSWSNPRGEGRYLRGILPPLVQAWPGRMVLLSEEAAGAALLEAVAGSGEADLVTLPSRRAPGRRLAAGSARTIGDLLAPARLARRLRPAALLQPSLVGWFPTPGVPQVVGVHDLKPTGSLGAEIWGGRVAAAVGEAKQRAGLHSARALWTISESTGRAIADRTGAAAPAIARPAIAPEFRPRSAAEIGAAREAIGLPADQPYLIAGSGLNRHKDPGLLIEALALERARGRHPPRVVLTGARRGAYGSIGAELERRARKLGVGEHLLMPGHVSDAVLSALYSGCEATVSASRFEGFGLPPVEAAACGAPIVLSRIRPHLETSADLAEFFEPGSPAAMLAALERVRERPRPRVSSASGLYSWEPAAAVVADRLEAVSAVGAHSS